MNNTDCHSPFFFDKKEVFFLWKGGILVKKTLFAILLLTIGIAGVNADAYYVNDNGLEFTEYQYDVMADMIGGENIRYITEEQYNTYDIGNMTPETHKYVTYEEPVSNTRLTTYETTSKKLSISAICYNEATYCSVTTFNEWKVDPKIRSYDVIGVRLSGTSFYDSSIGAYLMSEGTIIYPKSSKGASNGAGSVIQLPSTSLDYVTQTVRVLKGGTVFGSYQHAVKNVGYSVAYSFIFSSTGLGSVFVWDSSFGDIYDGMGGVYLYI